ncbi:MAG: hypothetical protein Alpg2KO_12470 [Alphaproteobacteria bacterium]
MTRKTGWQRGTTGISYGLVVGLIAVVALVAITQSGNSIKSLFETTSTSLQSVVDDTVPEPAPAPPATGPDAFDFSDTTGVSGGAEVASASVTLTGDFTDEAVSVSGGTNTVFRLNGGSWGSSGNANPGDSLEIQTEADGSSGGTQVVTITVGGVSDTWTVTTRSDCGGGRCIFFTSTTNNGSFGGATGADAICQARAVAGGLSGTFYAYLSEGSPGVTAANRFTWNAPYYNLSGGLVSNSAWPYTTNWVGNGITDEFGVMINSSTEFWSNTASNGNHCGNGTGAHGRYNNCQSFSGFDADDDGITGLYNGAVVNHLCQYWRDCSASYRFLCVEG